MAPVTEIAIISLKAGTSLDPTSESGKVLSSTLDTVAAQPGFQHAYYGLEDENQTTLRLFIDWNALEDHKNFINDPSYGPFMKNMSSVVDGAPTLYHASLNPHPPTPLSPTVAPTTEVLTVYFDPNISEADQKSFESNAQKLIDVIAKEGGLYGFKNAASSGWVIETVQHEGKDAKAFFGVLGWESKESHMKFRESQAFKDNIHLLRDNKGMVGVSMSHINAQEVQPGASGGGLNVQEEVLNPQAGSKNPPSTTKDGNTTKFTR